jgi:peptide/nickel transport system permease protein
MGTYILGRLLQLIPVILLSSFLVFMLLHLVPGDPAETVAGPDATPDVIAAVRHKMGLDRPLPVQYGIWLGNIARISLSVGLISVAIGFVFGATSGLISGYIGGPVDSVINRLWDCLLAFPVILLGIAVVLVTGPGAVNAAIAVGISNIPIFVRLARACALTEKERDYVHAARSLGGRQTRIVFRHLLPNALSPLLVQSAVAMAFAVLLEASLSFLGLGAQPPEPSWGSMLSHSRQFLRVAWWYGVFPGTALTILLIGLNYFSDAVRDAFDPRQINIGR